MATSQHPVTEANLNRVSARIPVRASIVRELKGTVREDGRAVVVRIWQSLDSDGYRSEYRPHLSHWAEVRVVGQPAWTKRYSGRRLERAMSEYAKVAELVVVSQ